MSTFTNDCMPVAGRRIGNERYRYSRACPLSKAAGKLFATGRWICAGDLGHRRYLH